VVGFCKYGDEPVGCGATELVSYRKIISIPETEFRLHNHSPSFHWLSWAILLYKSTMYKYKDFCLTVLQNRNTIRSELHMQAIASMFSSGLGDQVTVYICFQLHNTHTEVHKIWQSITKTFLWETCYG
jgi:hypothetical protein